MQPADFPRLARHPLLGVGKNRIAWHFVATVKGRGNGARRKRQDAASTSVVKVSPKLDYMFPGLLPGDDGRRARFLRRPAIRYNRSLTVAARWDVNLCIDGSELAMEAISQRGATPPCPLLAKVGNRWRLPSLDCRVVAPMRFTN